MSLLRLVLIDGVALATISLVMFGEMGSGEWITIIGASVTAIAAAYVTIVQTMAKTKADARQQQISEHERVLDRQEKELELHRRQLYDQQDVINRMHRTVAESREEAAEFYGFIRVFRNICLSLVDEVKRLGGNRPDIPDMPPRRSTTMRTADSEFLRRTTEQNTELIDKFSTQHPLKTTSDPSKHPSSTPIPPTKGGRETSGERSSEDEDGSSSPGHL